MFGHVLHVYRTGGGLEGRGNGIAGERETSIVGGTLVLPIMRRSHLIQFGWGPSVFHTIFHTQEQERKKPAEIVLMRGLGRYLNGKWSNIGLLPLAQFDL